MNKIIKLLLASCLIISNSFANILLQAPKKLSYAEIENMALDWETQFYWTSKKSVSFTCWFKKESGFAFKVFNLPVYWYNYNYKENLKSDLINYFNSFRTIGTNLNNYYLSEPITIDNPNPITIDLTELISLLKNKKFIFYTGAGISASSKVAPMKELDESLKMDKGWKNFFSEMIKNPQEVTAAFTTFCDSARYTQPSLAHFALKDIALHKSINILTENVDLLQQRTGIAPICLGSCDSVLNIFTPDTMKDIDIIICVGLSHDDRGLLGYYKEHNKQGNIVSIDLAIPNYLSSTDYLCKGDLQIFLPLLANSTLSVNK